MKKSKKTRIFLIGFALVLCVFAFASCAKKNKPSENLALVLNPDGESYSVAGIGDCMDEEVVLPSEHEGLPVTAISDFAFNACSSLDRITIPDSIEKIGKYAFAYCVSLDCVILPDSIETLDAGLFSGCSYLQSVTIPDSVIRIENSAFSFCTAMETLHIPDSVESIGASAFSGCTSLQNISLPTSLKELGNMAFLNCSSLESFTLPKSVTSVGAGLLSGCTSLSSIEVEKGNTLYHASGNCIIETNKKSLVFGCEISKIPTDGSVTSIGAGAFFGSDTMREFTIPHGIARIEGSAFASCSLLSKVIIPKSVTYISESSFEDCRCLYTIEYKGKKSDWATLMKKSGIKKPIFKSDIAVDDGYAKFDDLPK